MLALSRSHCTSLQAVFRLANSHSLPVRLKVLDPFSRSHMTLTNLTVRVVTVTAKILAEILKVEVAKDNKKKEKLKGKKVERKGETVPYVGIEPMTSYSALPLNYA